MHNRPDRQYGRSLQTAFRAATEQWVFYTGGDGQFDFRERSQGFWTCSTAVTPSAPAASTARISIIR